MQPLRRSHAVITWHFGNPLENCSLGSSFDSMSSTVLTLAYYSIAAMQYHRETIGRAFRLLAEPKSAI